MSGDGELGVALIHRLFHGPGADAELVDCLVDAKNRGASLAVLPELPLDHWIPGTEERRAEDSEPVGGGRQRRLALAAETAGLAVLGGAIVDEPGTRQRHNTALLHDRDGSELLRYRKVHLPEEEGFWEASQYEPGRTPPDVVEVGGVRVGVQICSDVNRPSGTHIVAARGAELLLVPRATGVASHERWMLVLRSLALMHAVYLVSVNRPEEPGMDTGAPSVAIGPDGEVLLETTEPSSVVRVSRSRLREARDGYPGYLRHAPDVYAQGWHHP